MTGLPDQQGKQWCNSKRLDYFTWQGCPVVAAFSYLPRLLLGSKRWPNVQLLCWVGHNHFEVCCRAAWPLQNLQISKSIPSADD